MPTVARLGRESLAVENALAYFNAESITSVKMFYSLAPHRIELLITNVNRSKRKTPLKFFSHFGPKAIEIFTAVIYECS